MKHKQTTYYNHNKNEFTLNQHNSWLLWGCQVINIAYLSLEVTMWMLAILALCLCWQALLISIKFKDNKQTNISPILLSLFAVSGCIAIAITANEHGVLLSMVHLLTFAYVLKAFEVKKRKDFYQLFLLGLFLLASALIFKQNLAFSIMIVLTLIMNFIVLQQVFSPSKTFFTSAKLIATLLLQSSLLAIVLFIFFPRLSPFWQVPSAKSAQTGLTDEVSPGDIANLALSSDLAFRVDFKGEAIPRYSNLYWRAMTLENYDGRKWSREKTSIKTSLKNPFFSPATMGSSIIYDIIAEPSFQPWLFGLTVANIDDANLILMPDYTIQSRKVLSQITHYTIESYMQAPLDITLNDADKQRNLMIVKGSNPRLEEFALELKQKYPDLIDRSNAVLALFTKQQYFYTLKAPLLINNSLDQFFFDTKAGFCVHYASAYTYLMRASGIPARVVTGYLGGEYNNISETQNAEQTKQQGGHLSIYQYDAHAWSEIWLAGIGWKKVDPTAAVDLQRVESGWSNALLTQQSLLNNELFGLHQFKSIKWLNEIRLQLDALDYQWTRWVLGYSSKQQYDLLKRWFGKNMQWKIPAIILLAFIIMMVLFTLLYRLNFNWLKRKKIAPWITLYQQVLSQLAKKGLKKPDDMTFSDFAQRVAEKTPEISQHFFEFTVTFESLMYQNLDIEMKETLLLKLEKQYAMLNKVI